MEQVGRRVVALGGLSLLAVHVQFDIGADFDRAVHNLQFVHDVATMALRVHDSRLAARSRHRADIAHLSPGLRVEGSAVEHREPGLRQLPRGFRSTVLRRRKAENPGHRVQVAIADELRFRRDPDFRRAASRSPRPIRFEPDLDAARHLRSGARALPLLRQRGLEPRLVDREPLLLGDLPHRLDRQAEGVVEAEHGLAAEDRPALRARFLDRLLDLAGADRDRLQEPGLLGGHRRRRRLAGRLQFRVVAGERLLERRQERRQERLLEAQLHAVARGAPEDAAQHVAPPLVARQHPVGEQEADGAEVVGDHPHGHVGVRVPAVVAPGRAGHRLEHRAEQVRVVVRVDSLQHGGDPLQPGAGIDRRVGKRLAAAVLVPLELHEDEVPDLEIAARLAAFVPADLGLAGRRVDEDLAARTAGARLAHRPEVVLLAAAQDPLRRQAGDPQPQVLGLVVLLEHGGEEVFGPEPPRPGDEFPGGSDRLLLEVVAEGEVAQHLEERVVARARADVLQVVVLAGHPQALLGGHRPRRLRLFDAEEEVLELDHPGVDEQQGRIVARHQRRARHRGVPAAGVEVDEALSDVATQHEVPPRASAVPAGSPAGS